MADSAPDQPVIAYVTVPDRSTGRAIASALIDNHEAACVNIVPGLESVYRWQGQVETGFEQLLIIKTRQALLTTIDQRLAELHPDDVPERIAWPITDGLPAYMDWLVAQTNGQR